MSNFNNINQKVANGNKDLTGLTKPLTPQSISNKYNATHEKGTNEFSYFNESYNLLHFSNNTAINSSISPAGFIQSPTSNAATTKVAPHWVNQGVRGTGALLDYGIGLGNGIIYGQEEYKIGGAPSMTGLNGNSSAYWAGVQGGQVLSPYNIGTALIGGNGYEPPNSNTAPAVSTVKPQGGNGYEPPNKNKVPTP